jgi:DNA repair protein SbcD/Mre11
VRLLHTADWHVGRTLMNVSRQPDIEAAVDEIITLAREEKPDLIIHAGDLFDAFRPATHDMHWAMDRLRELAGVAPVYVLSGNHDSPALFDLFNKLLGPDSRLRFIPHALPPDRGGVVELPGPGEEVIRFAAVPFVHAGRVVEFFEEAAGWMANYADRVGKIVGALDQGLRHGYDATRHVLLFAAHLFVSGARFSQSERPLTVTDAYATRAEHLPAVSYSAYGHIHRPQPLPGDGTGRYAGSVVPLDFGERDEGKEAVLVEARPGRAPVVEVRALKGGRPLRRLEGTLGELESIAPTVGDALCLVVVKTESTVPDLSERVRELLPDAVLLDVFEDSASSRLSALTERDVADDREATFAELFRDYLAAGGVRAGSADRVLQTFETLITAVENEQQAVLPEVDELDRSLALPGEER